MQYCATATRFAFATCLWAGFILVGEEPSHAQNGPSLGAPQPDSVIIAGQSRRVVQFSGRTTGHANSRQSSEGDKLSEELSFSRDDSTKESQGLALQASQQQLALENPISMGQGTVQVADLRAAPVQQSDSSRPDWSKAPNSRVDQLMPPRRRNRESITPQLEPLTPPSSGTLSNNTKPSKSPGEPAEEVTAQRLNDAIRERRELVQSVEELLSSVQSQDYLKLETALHPDWITEIRFPLLRYNSQYELSLIEAIHTAIEFAPEIEILRSQVGIDRAEVVRQEANFDWTHFIEANWDEQNTPNGSNLEGVDRLELHTLASSTGLTKLNQFGGQLQLAQELGYADSNSQIFFPANQANNGLVLEYQQPLLQGAGLLVNQSQINIAIANASVSQEDFVAGLQQHIFDVITAYWSLVSSRGQYIIQKRSYERALSVAKVIANRQHLDVGPVQSARAEATLGARRTAVLQAEYAVVFAQEQLLRLIFGSKFKATTNRELLPISDMLGPMRTVDMDMEVQLGLKNRPEVRRALQLIKRTSIEQGVAKNQLLPLLNLTMTMSNRGLQGNRGFLSAFTDQWDFGDPSYGIGLSYSLPVGNRAAKVNVKQAELRLRRIQKEFEQSVSDVVLEVRNASHNLALTGKQRRVSGNALDLARKELEILERRIILLIEGSQNGPLYLDDLLQTQERLATAELGLLDASASYATAVFELQRVNGSLLKCSPLPAEAAPSVAWTHRVPGSTAPTTVVPSNAPQGPPQANLPPGLQNVAPATVGPMDPLPQMHPNFAVQGPVYTAVPHTQVAIGHPTATQSGAQFVHYPPQTMHLPTASSMIVGQASPNGQYTSVPPAATQLHYNPAPVYVPLDTPPSGPTPAPNLPGHGPGVAPYPTTAPTRAPMIASQPESSSLGMASESLSTMDPTTLQPQEWKASDSSWTSAAKTSGFDSYPSGAVAQRDSGNDTSQSILENAVPAPRVASVTPPSRVLELAPPNAPTPAAIQR